MKDIFKNWFKGALVLFSLSALIAGLASCEASGGLEELLTSGLVKLRVFSEKTEGGAYRFVEYTGDEEPRDLTVKTIFRIDGFDTIYKEGTEYLISARKYTNEKTGAVAYNFIEIISSAPSK